LRNEKRKLLRILHKGPDYNDVMPYLVYVFP
jgi:hypothetical protein